jgi:hypothetical protein
MQPLRTDLDQALHFVVLRISEQAQREGQPLLESEHEFLLNLPKRPINPSLHSVHYPGDVGFGTLPIRDFDFERLCSLAKNAYAFETANNPQTRRQWHFAVAVFDLNNHPMSWLLRWAGIKVQKAATVTDGCLLLISGIAIVVLLMRVVFTFINRVQNYRQVQNVTLWIAGGSLFLTVVLALHLLTRRLETWQGKRTVEKYRCDLDDSAGFRV